MSLHQREIVSRALLLSDRCHCICAGATAMIVGKETIIIEAKISRVWTDGLHEIQSIWKDVHRDLELEGRVGDEALRFTGTGSRETRSSRLSRTRTLDGWAEEVRYMLIRYEERLAREAGLQINESQWAKVGAADPARSVEHTCYRVRASDTSIT